jgi:FtsP/CotA-like multicopper oxidase with cupredoxin domain
MQKDLRKAGLLTISVVAMLLVLLGTTSQAAINGDSGTTFNLTAKADHIVTGDGGSVLFWGYALDDRRAQYPGPTFIVNQGDTITVNLTNALTVKTGTAPNVSIVFPGQQGVTATITTGPGKDGLLTKEVGFGETVQYTFTATQAGTYLYHSGTSPELQVEMGLVGAIIVRPYMGANHAYNHADSLFDQEYLFLLTEMDPRIHQAIEFQGMVAVDPDWLSDYFPGWWFINGRNAPDTMLMADVEWLPTQPYNCMPRIHPGERMLMRVIDAGRDQHPFHHHGNHARVIAKDGRLLDTGSGSPMIDLSYMVFTVQSVPGETADAIFEWTSKGLGWDIYGDPADPDFAHQCNGSDLPSNVIDPATGEDCNDHGKPFPVVMPEPQSLTFGGHWSGSPFLGSSGSLPPGEGGLNPFGGLAFMWHSHTEKEMTNYDIFPGGMMTMMIIDPPGTMVP